MDSKFALVKNLQNILYYSQSFDVGSWETSAVTITANNETAPDGTQSAELVLDTTDVSSTSHYILQRLSGVFSEDTNYMFSIYAKPAGRNVLYMRAIGDVESRVVAFDLSVSSKAYEVGSSYSEFINNVGDDWWRVGVNFKTQTSVSSVGLQFIFAGEDVGNYGSGITYLGTGSEGMYLWGAQLHVGSSEIPYVLTSSEPLSDASDFVYVNPEYDYLDSAEKIENRHRARSSREYVYKWSQYTKKSMSVSFVNSEFKYKVNSWWSYNSSLQWHDLDALSYIDVKLVNGSQPIDSVVRPYTTVFEGTIELETY